jgi:peptidyl-prolyl cis-trans isomerase SurA
LAAACGSTPATPPAAAVSPDTWAVVDGRNITRTDVDLAFRRNNDPAQSPSEEEVLTAKLTLLNDLIVQDILIAKAAQLKIELPAADLDAAYDNAKKNIPDDVYQQELTKRGVTAGEMREGLRREMLSQKVIEHEVTSKVTVADQEITDFFNANRAQFNIPEEAYHIAQLIVTPVPENPVPNRSGDDAKTPQEATAKTQMLLERLKAGAAFPDLVVGYSEDPESTSRGGDLGFIPVSQLRKMPPNLRDAVLGKEPGTVSVVSVGGAHTLVLVVAHEQAGQRDLSSPEVKQRITDALRGRREQLLRAAYLTSIRSDAQVVNYLARRLVESQGKMPSLLPAAPAAPAGK